MPLYSFYRCAALVVVVTRLTGSVSSITIGLLRKIKKTIFRMRTTTSRRKASWAADSGGSASSRFNHGSAAIQLLWDVQNAPQIYAQQKLPAVRSRSKRT
jgi:hypothetical protein